MKKQIKDLLNVILSKTIKYNLVHELKYLDSEMSIWRKLSLHGFRADYIVDIGAARGWWTKEMLLLFPHANYFMVDPLDVNINYMKQVATNNHKVKYWQGLIGRKNGNSNMFAHGDQTSVFPSLFRGVERLVPMRTLDSFIVDGTVPRMDALKLDAQGAEIEVVTGALKLLEKCKVVQAEVSFRKVYQNAPLAHEVIACFAQRGFRIYDICSTGRRGDRALMEADLFFVSDADLFSPEKHDDSVYDNI